MPEVILDQSGTATQMTDTEYRRHVDAAKRNGQDVYASTDTGLSISLWDCVDHTWTKPLPDQFAQKHYLRKVVFKCSACDFHTSFDNDVASHAKRVLNKPRYTGLRRLFLSKTQSVKLFTCAPDADQSSLRGKHSVHGTLKPHKQLPKSMQR